MTDETLERLLGDLESDRVERKESLPSGKVDVKVLQAVCAFANDLPDHKQPGVVFIGVNDRGEPIGLTITDQMLQSLASIRSDGNILPIPTMMVEKRRLRGAEVAVVIVEPSQRPPVRFKGTVWIRVGPRRAIATADEERILNERRRHRDLDYDIHPIESATLDVLDELVFRRTYLPYAISRDVLEQNARGLEHQLTACRFAHPGEPPRPTVLGVLVVGKTPTDWIPGAYIQFLRIDGAALSDPIMDQKEIRGPLPDLMNEAEEVVKANIQTAVDFISGPTEIRRPDYPLPAIQQILRNAVMHRSYENTNAPVRFYWFDDRIEIQNPGGLYGHVNEQNYDHTSDYRNPNLAAVMKEMGYVQRFGAGISISRKAMSDNGNPPPEFQFAPSHVAVILRRRP